MVYHMIPVSQDCIINVAQDEEKNFMGIHLVSRDISNATESLQSVFWLWFTCYIKEITVKESWNIPWFDS